MFINFKFFLYTLLGCSLFLPQISHSQAPEKWELFSVGIRGGVNLDPGGIPPAEKENFKQYDVFGIIQHPGSWEWPGGWEARYRWYASAGALKAAGENGFTATLGPGIAFTDRDRNLTLELGTGAAFLSDERYGEQDTGGPLQILAHVGVSYHFPQHVTLGWRFQHFSDAGIYGKNNRGVDIHFLELSHRF